ncbi:MAG: response regulator [Candidatus Omnitrophota bacterium]
MSQQQGKSILLVDDEQDVLDSLSFFLSRNGYIVSVASNGTDGLKLAKENIPHLIILDLMLPDVDGSDVAVELLQNPATKNIPIVFLTSVFTKSEQMAIGDLIANRCIVAKPCKPEEILSLVKQHIGASI